MGIGKGNGAGSLGGGIGAGEEAGVEMGMPAVRESVEGGRGGSWIEEEEARGSEVIVEKSVRTTVVSRSFRPERVGRWN